MHNESGKHVKTGRHVGPSRRQQARAAAGDIAKVTIHEGVAFPRRFHVTGPDGLAWHKVDGGYAFSVFASPPLTIGGPVTIQLIDRTTDIVRDETQVALVVA